MKKLREILPFIAIPLAAILLFEAFFPRDESAAQARLEDEGYIDVRVSETRRNCGRNRQLFLFEAQRSTGEPVTGRLCFDLIRPLSTVTEDDELAVANPRSDRPVD